MHEKNNKVPNCKKCEVGFVDLHKDNYIAVGIIEKYGLNVFTNGMGGINTNAIKDVVISEGYDEYQDIFHRIVLFVSTALSTSIQR